MNKSIFFKNIIVLCLICCFTTVKAQNKNFILNDSVKYDFARVSMQIIGKKYFISSMEIVLVVLTDGQKQIIKNIKKAEWLKLLVNDSTDWGANIILYNLYERDAVQYKINITNRYYYLGLNEKKKEIKYWKAHLK